MRLRNLLVPPGTKFTLGEGLSFAMAYFTVGLTVAVLHVSEGTEPAVMLAGAFLVNAVTPTLAYAAVTSAGGSVVAGVLSGWLVASRFGLFAAALSPHLWSQRWRRGAAAHFSWDPNAAVALREANRARHRLRSGDTEDAQSNPQLVWLAATIWLAVPWWIGAGVGVWLGDLLGDPDRWGLDAVFPAVLLAIVWPSLAERLNLAIAVTAVCIALALVEITPGGVPALAAAFAALLAVRGLPRSDAESAAGSATQAEIETESGAAQ